MKESAKRMEEDKKERLDNAFRPRYVQSGDHKYTKSEPFQLSTPSQKDRERERELKVKQPTFKLELIYFSRTEN